MKKESVGTDIMA